MRLTLDVGLRGLPLGVEGVEVLFEPLVGRDAGVDRAAQAASGRVILQSDASLADAPFALQEAVLFLLFRRSAPASAAAESFPGEARRSDGPFQLVPVIALAIWDRLPKV